jgi:transposase
MDIVTIFCAVDDFCQPFAPVWQQHWLPKPGRQRRRACRLALSEALTLVIWFHLSGYRCFKHFYLRQVCTELRSEFPHLPSYGRMVELLPATFVPLCALLHRRLAATHGIAFIDSFALKVCHNRRIHSHKVFAGVAQRGKSSMGWFYGLKLHLVINDQGELVAVQLTPGNTDDRTPVPTLTRRLQGKLFGERGYLGPGLFTLLWARGLQMVTKIKRNMKNKLLPLTDKLLLRKRGLIECVGGQLKHWCQIEHTRHRSVTHAYVNILAALVAYSFRPHKPSLNLTTAQTHQIATMAF